MDKTIGTTTAHFGQQRINFEWQTRRQMPEKNTRKAKPDQPPTILQQRLAKMIVMRRTKAQIVSKQAGFNPGLVRDVIAGKVLQPRQEALGRIAEILQTDVAYLLGQHDDASVRGNGPVSPTPPALRRHGVRPIRVVGFAQIGVFQADPFDWNNEQMIDGITNRMLPDAQHFAIQLRDNAARDNAHDRKGYALCVEAEAMPVADGKTYAIQRKNSDGQVEVSVRVAKILPDGIELRDYINGKDVLRVGRDLDYDTSKPVAVVGLAYAHLQPLL